MKSLKIGQVAKAVELTVEGVRFYEKIGLIPPVERARSGHRMYRPEVVGRIKFIQQLQELGYQLDDIKAVLSEVDEDWESRGKLVKVLSHQIATLEKNWKMLTQTKAILSKGKTNENEVHNSADFFREFQKINHSHSV